MGDIALTFDCSEDEQEKAREALRGSDISDAVFLEEDEKEGREEPVLRFNDGVSLGEALRRTEDIKRATCEEAYPRALYPRVG